MNVASLKACFNIRPGLKQFGCTWSLLFYDIKFSNVVMIYVRHEYGIFSMDLEVGYKVFFLVDSCR